MKITRVESLPVGPNLLVRLHTDEGVVGYGECSPMNNAVTTAHLEHALAPIVVGQDPFDVERIVERGDRKRVRRKSPPAAEVRE